MGLSVVNQFDVDTVVSILFYFVVLTDPSLPHNMLVCLE
jgi:hypothetical protein